jgi:glycine cleavage system aminomethyltransferase T
MRLTSSDGADAGWVTSATRSPRLQKDIALGFVKRGFNEIGTELREAKIVALPFV